MRLLFVVQLKDDATEGQGGKAVRVHACIDGIASTRYGDPVTRVLREGKREREKP